MLGVDMIDEMTIANVHHTSTNYEERSKTNLRYQKLLVNPAIIVNNNGCIIMKPTNIYHLRIDVH